jgi:hypothetical protein
VAYKNGNPLPDRRFEFFNRDYIPFLMDYAADKYLPGW